MPTSARQGMLRHIVAIGEFVTFVKEKPFLYCENRRF